MREEYIILKLIQYSMSDTIRKLVHNILDKKLAVSFL